MFKKQIVGIDISDRSIEALVLRKAFFGKPRVVAYARVVLRGEVIKNGVIKNPQKLAEHLTQLLKSAHPRPIKARQCIVSIPESQVFTTVFKLPAGLRRREIYNTIPVKAEEVIPFKSSEVYFDFKTLAVEGESQEVFYVATPMRVVDAYVTALQAAALQPVALDLESVSLARALIGPVNKSDGAKLLMDIGARSTNLNIFDRNGIRQSLTVRIAGDRFTKAVAKALGLPAKEAIDAKIKNGFDPKKNSGKVLMALQNECKRIIAEARTFIDYYQTEYARKITGVILAGGSALLPQVDQYLANNLGIETSIGNPFAKVVDPKNLTKLKSKSVLFSNVAGLALRGVTKNPIAGDINLLPLAAPRFTVAPPRNEKKAWRLIYVRLLVLMLLLMGLLGVWYSKNQGFDLYQQVFPEPQYQSEFISDIDPAILDELRASLLLDLTASSTATTTATTTSALTAPPAPTFTVRIRPTSVGYLNVRSGPSTTFDTVTQANSGTEYPFIEEQSGWYHIRVDDALTGWVITTFAERIEVPPALEASGVTSDSDAVTAEDQ